MSVVSEWTRVSQYNEDRFKEFKLDGYTLQAERLPRSHPEGIRFEVTGPGVDEELFADSLFDALSEGKRVILEQSDT